jgi:hypothetical protein
MTSGPVKRVSLRVVPLLLTLQALSVYLLWTLNPSGRSGQAEFAVTLAAVLVSLSLVSYIFRVEKWGRVPSRALIVVGSIFLLVLLFAGLLV